MKRADDMVIAMRSTDFGGLSDEALIKWLTSHDRRPNLVIVAHDVPVQAIADRLKAACAPPILPSVLPGRLHLPASRRGTVLLENVTELSLPQQILMNDWIAEGPGDAQIISITTTPLWRLVQNGDFLEGLFYRLNVVQLHAAPGSPVAAGEPPDEDHESEGVEGGLRP